MSIAAEATAPSTQPPVIEPSIAALVVDVHLRADVERRGALDLDEQPGHDAATVAQPLGDGGGGVLDGTLHGPKNLVEPRGGCPHLRFTGWHPGAGLPVLGRSRPCRPRPPARTPAPGCCASRRSALRCQASDPA